MVDEARKAALRASIDRYHARLLQIQIEDIAKARGVSYTAALHLLIREKPAAFAHWQRPAGGAHDAK